MPPLTPEGQAARRETRGRPIYAGGSDSWEDRSLYDRCITRGFPGSSMPTIYGNSSRIVQGPGYVAIQYEMIHETRVIPHRQEPRPHPAKSIRLDMGDARGHWEGDTLVVETTNFTDAQRLPQREPRTLKITERFTRIAPDKVTLVGDDRRSDDVDAAVDVLDAAHDERRRADSAVRMPRRQLRAAEHPQRGARRGARPVECNKTVNNSRPEGLHYVGVVQGFSPAAGIATRRVASEVWVVV